MKNHDPFGVRGAGVNSLDNHLLSSPLRPIELRRREKMKVTITEIDGNRIKFVEEGPP